MFASATWDGPLVRVAKRRLLRRAKYMPPRPQKWLGPRRVNWHARTSGTDEAYNTVSGDRRACREQTLASNVPIKERIGISFLAQKLTKY
jgi:hypothetical protein